MEKERKHLCLEIDETLLEQLKKKASEKGVHPAELAAELLEKQVTQTPVAVTSETKALPEDVKKTLTHITRQIQDLLIPYTGKLDDIRRTIAELVERVEKLEEQIKAITEKTVSPPPPVYERADRRIDQRQPTRRATGGRPTAIERLRQQGAVFQSDLKWLNNPPAFFDKLRREGAIVMQLGGEYIAVDPEYWSQMERTLAQLDEPDPVEAEKKLPSPMNRLFRVLYENERAYYDSIEKGWRIIPPE